MTSETIGVTCGGCGADLGEAERTGGARGPGSARALFDAHLPDCPANGERIPRSHPLDGPTRFA